MKTSLSPKNIIVRMPNWIGDLIMATPVLVDLRNFFPEARITAMCRAPLGDVLKEDPLIDEVFSFKRVKGFSRRAEERNIIEKLQKGSYDLGVLLTHSFSSAWWFWQGKIPHRIGYVGHWRRFLLTIPVAFPKLVKKQHLVTTYKMLLEPLGISLSETAPRLILQNQEIEEAQQLLSRHAVSGGFLVGINPGAAYGSAKCWLPERFREVTERLLADEKVFIVYFGDQSTAPLVKEICQGLPSRVVNLAGMTSLRELACLIRLCDVVLTNDSGPMHIADALGTPLLALFGSTSEVVTGPYNSKNVIHKHTSCSPCYQRTCPIDFRCMKQIEADEVYHQIYRLLKMKSSKSTIC